MASEETNTKPSESNPVENTDSKAEKISDEILKNSSNDSFVEDKKDGDKSTADEKEEECTNTESKNVMDQNFNKGKLHLIRWVFFSLTERCRLTLKKLFQDLKYKV